MSRTFPQLPEIPEADRTPLVVALLEIIAGLQEQTQALKDEVARLKGQQGRPNIKPSNLAANGGARDRKRKRKKGKRAGSAKRSKTRELKIHETVVVPPDQLPPGSRFKGYREFTVQDLIIRPHNTRYRLECWLTPSGDYVVGKLPAAARHGHFGTTAVSYVLYQHFHAHVTQPLIHEHLLEFGLDISAGQVNRIITENQNRFHAEKDAILQAGLEVSKHIHVDDTGARHQGRNGYCTHIGNATFAWFKSTESKSRINFLQLLRAGKKDYVVNDEALAYMRTHKLPLEAQSLLATLKGESFQDEEAWSKALKALQICTGRHVRIATEGALVGSLSAHGLHKDLVVVSDDAGQFDVLLHALCWVHTERHIHKLVGFNAAQREAVANIRGRLWDLYEGLSDYKRAPSIEKRVELEADFDKLFTRKTCFASLNLVLKRIYANKAELLLVLDRPDIPLHNNLSERDIREYVKKRKISGCTRSDAGRLCRDTFTSLKKTCRKLGVSFWRYLTDRLCGEPKLPGLDELLRQQAVLTTA